MEAIRLEPEAELAPSRGGGVGRGTITSVVSRERVRVRTASGAVRVATLAAVGYVEPREGDPVVLAEGADECFVLGVLGAARSPEASPRSAPPGAAGAGPDDLAGDPPPVPLARDADGTVRLAEGDLRLEVAAGALELVARDGVRIRTERALELRADTLDAAAERAELRLDEGRVVARSLATTADTVAVVAELVEIEADRLVERARNAFREVEELAQTRAGRLRAIARGALSLFGKNVSLAADEDAKVDGQRVLLG